MISSWSIKNPVPTIVIFMTMAIVGYFSFTQLGIDSQPNVDIASVQVTVSRPGAGPTELETQVTRKIEDAVAGLGNIDEITSNVTDGKSTTNIQFVLGTDADQATNDVRNAISQVRSSLPQDINEPTVNRLRFAGGSVMTYTVASEQRSVEELSDIVDRQIARALSAVPGVAQVERLGGVDREIRVNLDSESLNAHNITATQVNDQIRRFNINLPGGRAEIGGSEQNIRTLGSAKTVEDLKNYPIVLGDGSTIPLRSLGEVKDSFSEPRQAAFLNSKPVVAFSILRSAGSTLVTVEGAVKEAIAQLQKTLPPDLKIKLNFTRAKSIRDSYEATLDDLIVGCILTVIIVGLFLRDWRMTLITSVALPLSILPTFWVMKSLNYTLNGMTLLALALALGNLIDDAVCMVENIDQHLQKGETPYQAALNGSKELGWAVLISAATMVGIFLPVAFMGGIPGQFFQPFGVTIAVSTIFSTLVACTVTPMMSAYLITPKKVKISRFSQADLGVNGNGKLPHLSQLREELDQTLRHSRRPKFYPYRSLLTWALRNRALTLIITIVFFIGSLQLLPLIPKGLIDRGDVGLSTLTVELPPGSTLGETKDVLLKTSEMLKTHPAVDSVLARADQVNSGSLFISLVPKEERISQKEFQQQMRSKLSQIPGARLSFRSNSATGGGRKDFSIVLKSENVESLTRTSEILEQQMRDLPGLVEVTSTASLVKPELIIEPDVARATDLGVSVETIARTASLASLGDLDSNLAKFNLPDRQIPIRVQINPEERKDLEMLQNLRVPSTRGELVPLSAVANIRLGSGPAEIKRFDRARQVTIDANLNKISLGQANEIVHSLPAMSSLPPDIFEEPAGNAKTMRDIFARFLAALGLGVLSIYALLILLYNNFLYPFTILAALPLSIGGTLLGLLVMQKELGLYALIGIVLLMGLVTKNAILLVDCTLAGLEQGKPQFKAIIEAGVSRLRPIVMTSVSTIAGMIPVALAWGAEGEVRSPMAIAVIGGFTTSTLLTLVVVPVFFTYIDNIVHWFDRFSPGKDNQAPLLSSETTETVLVKREAIGSNTFDLDA